MKIFVTGDIHGGYDIHKLSSTYFNNKNELGLTKDDYLIICGDFGLIWDYKGENDTETYWLNWLEEKPWTTLFVDGNHECHPRLNGYPVEKWNGGNVHKIRKSILHLMRGQVFDINGFIMFTMGGAPSHDKAYRTEGKSWWPEEIPYQNERIEAINNLDKHNWEVDCVITHDAPSKVADEIIKTEHMRDRYANAYTYWLQEIANKLTFGKWFFGHYHVDREMSEFGNYQAVYNDIVFAYED